MSGSAHEYPAYARAEFKGSIGRRSALYYYYMFGANYVNLLDYVHNLDHPNPILSFHDMMLEFKQEREAKKRQQAVAIGVIAPSQINVSPPMQPQNHLTTKVSFGRKATVSNNLLAIDRPLMRKSSMLVRGTSYLNDTFLPVRYNSRQSISRSENGDIQINQYLIKEELGRGAFAKVRLCEDTSNRYTYAVKILDSHKLKKLLFRKDTTNKADKIIRSEIASLKRISHPNIIKLIEVIEDEEYSMVYLIMEYCQKGCINKSEEDYNPMLPRTSDFKKLTEEQARPHMRSLLLALDYLHNTAKMAHRDIKPENMLIDSHDQLKLTDFGLSSDDMISNKKSGTRVYMAPETYSQNEFDLKASDVWSVGITLYRLLTTRLPYPYNIPDYEIATVVQNAVFDFSHEMMSEELKSFLYQCLEKDPKKRATVRDLMKHVWITQGINPLTNKTMTIDLEVTEEDKQKALQPIQGKGIPRRKNYELKNL